MERAAINRVGYFGKIPGARDFVFQGLPMRTTERWAGFMAEWLARGSRVHRDDWRRAVLTSPVWRFALGRDIISAESWIGLLAGSIDGAGRLFPFTAMIAADIDPERQQPFEAMDRALDQVEPAFLDFMESGLDRQPLIDALGQALAQWRTLATVMPDAPGDGLLLADAGEQARCLIDDARDAAGGTLMAYPDRGTVRSEPSACSVWWHAATSQAPATRCISRGMPQALIALPFFDADWARHGWVHR
jgi:type VI secretion system protein ImpM